MSGSFAASNRHRSRGPEAGGQRVHRRGFPGGGRRAQRPGRRGEILAVAAETQRRRSEAKQLRGQSRRRTGTRAEILRDDRILDRQTRPAALSL